MICGTETSAYLPLEKTLLAQIRSNQGEGGFLAPRFFFEMHDE